MRALKTVIMACLAAIIVCSCSNQTSEKNDWKDSPLDLVTSPHQLDINDISLVLFAKYVDADIHGTTMYHNCSWEVAKVAYEVSCFRGIPYNSASGKKTAQALTSLPLLDFFAARIIKSCMYLPQAEWIKPDVKALVDEALVLAGSRLAKDSDLPTALSLNRTDLTDDQKQARAGYIADKLEESRSQAVGRTLKLDFTSSAIRHFTVDQLSDDKRIFYKKIDINGASSKDQELLTDIIGCLQPVAFSYLNNTKTITDVNKKIRKGASVRVVLYEYLQSLDLTLMQSLAANEPFYPVDLKIRKRIEDYTGNKLLLFASTSDLSNSGWYTVDINPWGTQDLVADLTKNETYEYLTQKGGFDTVIAENFLVDEVIQNAQRLVKSGGVLITSVHVGNSKELHQKLESMKQNFTIYIASDFTHEERPNFGYYKHTSTKDLMTWIKKHTLPENFNYKTKKFFAILAIKK